VIRRTFALSIALTFLPAASTSAQAPRQPEHLSGGPTYYMGGVAADGARVVVHFNNSGLVYASTSEDCGGTWSPLVRVDSDPDRLGKWANSVDDESVHVHGDHVYAAWQDSRSAASRDMWFGRSTDGGHTFTDGSLGLSDPGVWTMKVARGAAPTQDRIHVLASPVDPAHYPFNDLVLATSSDGGATFAPPVDVSDLNGTATADVRQLALYAEGNRVVVAWVDERAGDFATYARVSNDGGATFGAEQRLSAATGGLVNNFVDVAGEGDVIAVGWLELEASGTDSVHVQVSSDGGATFGPDEVVGDYQPAVDDADTVQLQVVQGHVVCAWNDDRHGDNAIFVATSTDGGGTYAETRLTPTTGHHFSPRLAREGARLAVVWKNNSTSPRSAGSSYSTDAGLTWSAPLVVSAGTDDGTQAALALEGGHVHVAWLANHLTGNAWDSYVGGYDLMQAGVANRTAGSNAASYTAAPAILGESWGLTVDLAQTGHDFALVRIQSAPAALPLGTGDVFLLGGALLFRTPLLPGPLAQHEIPLPPDWCLSGLTVYSQAVHFGGVQPFALSNAQDLTVGSY